MPGAAEEFEWAKAPKAALLQVPAANEISGLAASARAVDGLWLINDSGGEPMLYLAGLDGADRGKVKVEPATNVDWEDLAGFSWQGKPYLLIADVGDNEGRRASCTLYIGVFVFPRNREESWAAAFARKPVVLPRHGLWQAESIAFSRDGKKLFVVSEGARSPIVTYQLQRKN